MSSNTAIKEALQQLARQDDDIARALNAYGYPRDRRMTQSFESLAKIIIGQQISRIVATNIWNRLDEAGWTSASAISRLDCAALKIKGLSLRKAEYIKGLAIAIEDGSLNLAQLPDLTGDDVQARLTALRGIGAWTADNYRLFALGDMDAWPGNDMALQEGMKRLKNMAYRPDLKEMTKLAESWSPYRGAGALLLWHLYAAEVRSATPSEI